MQLNTLVQLKEYQKKYLKKNFRSEGCFYERGKGKTAETPELDGCEYVSSSQHNHIDQS